MSETICKRPFVYRPACESDVMATWKAHGFKPTTDEERRRRNSLPPPFDIAEPLDREHIPRMLRVR